MKGAKAISVFLLSLAALGGRAEATSYGYGSPALTINLYNCSGLGCGTPAIINAPLSIQLQFDGPLDTVGFTGTRSVTEGAGASGLATFIVGNTIGAGFVSYPMQATVGQLSGTVTFSNGFITGWNLTGGLNRFNGALVETFMSTPGGDSIFVHDALFGDFTGFVDIGASSPTGSWSGGAPSPLPAALPLFVTGLGALGLLGWRRKRR